MTWSEQASRGTVPRTVTQLPSSNPWAPAAQNICALAAIVSLALADKINGEVASGMILAVTGVIALPALRKGGAGHHAGTLGCLTFAAPAWRAVTLLLGAKYGG